MDLPPTEHERKTSPKATEGRPRTPSDAPPTAEHLPIPSDLFCQQCGYNLRGLTSDRCPECGRSLDGLRGTVPPIPWVHRKEIGWFRVYWKTVWTATFRQQDLCDEMGRPVSRTPDTASIRLSHR